MNTFVTGRRLARELGEWRSNAPAYRSLAERIRVLLMDGRLSSGAKLPAERELSQALDLSRTTVAAAYSKLREDGFLDSVRGSGSTLRLPGMERGEHGLHPGLTLDFTKATTPAYPGLQAAYASALSELPRYYPTTALTWWVCQICAKPLPKASVTEDYPPPQIRSWSPWAPNMP
ncbi:winged helix-turn-helix domain-containing protein [Arthrobacter alpinus]|nr:winged helix-turn-helix domain-containing protein [Arthrobacter alpinus]